MVERTQLLAPDLATVLISLVAVLGVEWFDVVMQVVAFFAMLSALLISLTRFFWDLKDRRERQQRQPQPQPRRDR